MLSLRLIYILNLHHCLVHHSHRQAQPSKRSANTSGSRTLPSALLCTILSTRRPALHPTNPRHQQILSQHHHLRADDQTFEVLFAISKERMTRSTLMAETCLDVLELDLDNVVKVVMNNNHHRILQWSNMILDSGRGIIDRGVEEGYIPISATYWNQLKKR